MISEEVSISCCTLTYKINQLVNFYHHYDEELSKVYLYQMVKLLVEVPKIKLLSDLK